MIVTAIKAVIFCRNEFEKADEDSIMETVVSYLRPSFRIVGKIWDGSAEWLADTEADGYSDTNNKHQDNDLQDDAISLAHFGHAATSGAVYPGRLCLLFPVLLAWPNLAIGVRSLATHRLSRAVFRVTRNHSLNVCVKGVGILPCGRCREC